MAAASCDGGDGENNVDFSMVEEVGGANACHYVVYCRTVYHPLAHRYEQVKDLYTLNTCVSMLLLLLLIDSSA